MLKVALTTWTGSEQSSQTRRDNATSKALQSMLPVRRNGSVKSDSTKLADLIKQANPTPDSELVPTQLVSAQVFDDGPNNRGTSSGKKMRLTDEKVSELKQQKRDYDLQSPGQATGDQIQLDIGKYTNCQCRQKHQPGTIVRIRSASSGISS